MTRRLFMVLTLVLFLQAVTFAADVSVETGTVTPPESVSDAIKGTLAAESVTVSVDGATLAQFWFRSQPVAAASPSTDLGVNFGKIEDGSLVGVIQLESKWADYKKDPIAPGVYTLRYEVMPADGNHMGVATYRDFLLLSPIANDKDPNKNLGFEDMVSLSSEATGVPHPAVLSLFPVWDPVSKPTIIKNDLDQPTLAVPVGDVQFGLVVEGHGEI
jgi:hypothetical protein